ncbi:Cystinosin [Rhynchospora pubera]|uniref:Cystinosin homolog n=1 Tax=Rhynchospora pubera TaxID=906938 RepID=A0AAV8DEE4_9POAL|nr:Cystinosin [Rhynchospora pubera]
MDSWNSIYEEVAYGVLGWISFLSWSLCFYPQVLLNYRRKSVVGFNFDFPALNLTKHTSYLVYNAAMYFNPEIHRQYHQKYGLNQMIPVGLNDVFFSIHALSLTIFTMYQIFIYERGTQKVSKTCIAITAIIWTSALVCIIIAWPKHSWLWLISVFNTFQVIITTIKYIPQAVTNFNRKSTVGWSIGFVFFDLFGGLFSFGQMCAQSIDQGSVVNFYGNIGKLLLSLEVMLFDLLFIVQHYVLYPEESDKGNMVVPSEEAEPFIDSGMQRNKGSASKDDNTGTGTDDLMIVAGAGTPDLKSGSVLAMEIDEGQRTI